MSSRLSNSCSSDSVHCRIWSISLRRGLPRNRCAAPWQTDPANAAAGAGRGWRRRRTRLRTARFFGARARLLGDEFCREFLDELFVLVAQADLRGDRARLPIDEQQDVAEHRDPHHAQRGVAVTAEHHVAQRQHAEDRHGERVQRGREVRVRHDADSRPTREACGDQRQRAGICRESTSTNAAEPQITPATPAVIARWRPHARGRGCRDRLRVR